MSNRHTGNVLNSIAQEEHEHSLQPATKNVLVYGYDGSAKQIIKLDSSGNQQLINTPYSYYQQTSLVSGYVYHGFTSPGNAANTALFRIQRETLNTGELLFASGVATYTHTWSAASLASITYA